MSEVNINIIVKLIPVGEVIKPATGLLWPFKVSSFYHVLSHKVRIVKVH